MTFEKNIMIQKLFYFLSFAVLLCSCSKEEGCMDLGACNFDIAAEKDDGSCLFRGEECDDGDESTINDQINGTCQCSGQASASGCTDENACNYDANAGIDDGSCLNPGDDCNDGNPGTINDLFNSDCECEGEESISGCTDSTSCNFDSSANSDNGSCVYPGDDCNDGNPGTTEDVYDENCECNGIISTEGCTDTSACNFNPNATIDNGTCENPGDDCDDGDASTLDDVWTNNCECAGIPAEDDACALDAEGYATVYFGIYADGYPDECSYEIYSTDAPDVTTGTQYVTEANTYNGVTFGLNSGFWTMRVDDTYGDGKLENGFYFAQCLTNVGDWIDLLDVPFTDGYESESNFLIGDGLVSPSVQENY